MSRLSKGLLTGKGQSGYPLNEKTAHSTDYRVSRGIVVQ